MLGKLRSSTSDDGAKRDFGESDRRIRGAVITSSTGPIGFALRLVDAEFGKQAKMKRPAQPEEMPPAFVFLASPQTSSYITGEVLPVIGGY